MITRVRSEFVLAHDGSDHVLLRDAEVLVSGDRILHVGERTHDQVDETLDLGTALVVPGLIDLDALADIDHALIDAHWSSEHASGLQWSEDYARNRRRDVFTREEKAFIRWYALLQLVLHGVTTAMPIAAETHSSWAETFDETVDMAEAAESLGLRLYLGPSFRAGVNATMTDGSRGIVWDEEEGALGLADAVRFLQWAAERPGDLVHGALLPCRIETLTEELAVAVAKAGAEHDVPVRLHCLQGITERELLRARYGCGPVEFLRRAGLLNDRLLIPHVVHIDTSSYVRRAGVAVEGEPGELGALAEAGVSVVHCPLTSIRYGVALESFGRYREAGLNLTLGTDSFPPDLVRGIDYGVNLAKLVDGRLDATSHADYLRAATLGGATALRRPDLGRIAVGATADLVAFRLDDLRDGVLDDPLRTLAMSSSARSLTLSMIAGRVVVRDGQVADVDVAAVRARAQELFGRMRAAYSDRDALGRSTEELFPPSFAAG